MYGFIMACVELYDAGENKNLSTCGFQTHPPKPSEAEPSFRKVSLPLQNYIMLFPLHLWVREFWPQTYSF